MTNKVKIKVKVPTQAKRGLEWGTRKPVVNPREFVLTQTGTRARASVPTKLQIPRGKRARDRQTESKSKSKSTSPLKPKEGLNGAPVNQSWSTRICANTDRNAGEGVRATKLQIPRAQARS